MKGPFIIIIIIIIIITVSEELQKYTNFKKSS
jgi:hypothetical protein